MGTSNKNSIIAIVAVVALIGIGVGVFALTRDSGEDATTSTSQNQTETTAQETTEPELSNIVGLAQSTSNLSTLVAAVKAASLVDTLNGDGPFTVFAPTNNAFDKLPAGTLESLLLPENKPTLTGILTYHVVAGKVMSSDLKNGQIINTINGTALSVEIIEDKVTLVDAKGNKSNVTTADVEASNGVVHIIDSVVLPQ